MSEFVARPEHYLHLTCHSGLRLRANDHRILQVGHPAKPFMVVESAQGYTSIASCHRLDLNVDQEGCIIHADDLEVLPAQPSLESAVEAYLKRRPLPAPAGRANGLTHVVTLDMWLSDGRIAHTYKDVLRLVDDLVQLGFAEGTLLYLPGWHAAYDTEYPAYAPSSELGGADQFRRMLESANQAGIVVMPHLNYWGYDVSTGLIKDYQELQVREEGELLGWPGMTRTGSTNPLAYMRLDDPRWQKVFLQYLEPLLEDYPLHALFLDQIGTWQGKDQSFDQAAEEMLRRLRQIQPGLLLGGEVLTFDALTSHIDIYQAWGQPWCGLHIDFTDSFSPIIAVMTQGKVKQMAHLGLPCATPNRYCWTNYPFIVEHGVEHAFELAQQHCRITGCLPHVRLNYNHYGIDPQSLAVLRQGAATT